MRQLSLKAIVIVLLSCLFEGFYGIRMIKVSIPAFKLRGESTFLECKYELERRKSSLLQEGYQDMNRVYTSAINYSNGDAHDEDATAHTNTYGHTHQQHQEHYHRQPYYQHFKHIKRSTQYQHSHNLRQHDNLEHEDEWPYRTPPSPYGHSIYRGRSSASVSASASASSSLSSSSYSVNFDTHTRSRTHSLDVNEPGREHHGRGFVDSFEDSQQEQSEDADELEDEEQEELYAIKWYKDNEEFYRYVLKANPQKTSYRVDGVRVVEEHSDSSRVLLRGLTINATGLYRCEISAEAPNFSSVVGEGHMDVVYLPRDGPHIKGQQLQYQIGEALNVNCTSGKSHPASFLQWYINERPIIDKNVLITYNNTVHKHGLITATLGLNLIVEPIHFDNGAMRVKCVASISPVLWKGGKESILQRRPGLIDNREAMLLVHGASSSIHFKNFQRIYLQLIIIFFFVKIIQL